MLVAQLSFAPSVVGGFSQWRQAGRRVKKGEHGMGIWIPVGKPKDEKEPEPSGEKEKDRIHFVLGTVFSIEQTEPIEELATV